MTQKLDAFRPTPEIQAGVKRRLLEADVPPEALAALEAQGWIEAIAAATFSWIKNTREGAAYAADRLLDFDVFTGEPDREYLVTDAHGHGVDKVPAEDIYFFRGVTARGQAIPFSHLRISEKERMSCDDCCIISHCTKPIRDPFRDSLKNLCNYCIVHSDHPKVYEEGDRGGCARCPATSCSHHPDRQSLAHA
jgi:hypothetical protein